MFEVGFTEIILILGIALLVLGPEKLPKLANQVGRWAGRARAMARQLRQQLDEEVTIISKDELGAAGTSHAGDPGRRHAGAAAIAAARRQDGRVFAAAMSDADEQEKLTESTLLSHLLELRDRLLRALVATLVIALPCLYFANDIFTWLSAPLRSKLPEGATLIATSVVAPFMTPFKLALLAAIFFAMPVILYQVWAFVAPGLYRHERRFALPLFVSSVILFYSGAAFAYFVVFPVIFQFFVMTTPEGVEMMTDITQYLDFAVLLFFAFGLAFEIPVATVLLVRTGLVTREKLAKNRGYVLLGIFIIAAFLTPPDPVSQTLMALPMYALYEAGVLMSRFLVRKESAAPQDDAA